MDGWVWISKVTIAHEFDKVWFDLVKEVFMAIEVFFNNFRI